MEQQEEQPAAEEQFEHTVSILGDIKKVKLDQGKRLSDLLEEVKTKYKEELKTFSFEQCNIVLNGKAVNKSGELIENPVLSRASTLSLMPQITGGIRQ